MSLEGKLGLNLTLSWLVRVQVGAKRGKLTLLRGLGGVILRILEAPKRILGPLGALLGPLGRVLGASWGDLGASSEPRGGPGDGLGASWGGLLGACWHEMIFDRFLPPF